ncbi:MAG: hypothetical protein R3B72_15740 [Polyangiaceae bacterium]
MSAEAFDPRRTALGYQAVVSAPLAGEAPPAEAPRQVAEEFEIAELFHVRTSHGTVGPVPRPLIEKGFAAGRIPEDAEVRRVGEAAWRPIELLLGTGPVSEPPPVVVSRVVAIDVARPVEPPRPPSALQQLKSTMVMPVVDPEAETTGQETAEAIAWTPQAMLPPGPTASPMVDLTPPSLPVDMPPMNPVIGVLPVQRGRAKWVVLAVVLSLAVVVATVVLLSQLG